MNTPLLIKRSPLSGLYRHYPTQLIEVAGWEIAQHWGSPDQERQQLETGSVLVDWSHMGKVSLSGAEAAAQLGALRSPPSLPTLLPLSGISQAHRAYLRLTPNDFLVLLPPGEEIAFLAELDPTAITVTDQTGALGSFALAGPQRQAVLERSTAMNLRADCAPPGSVLQTTLHGIRCTLYRRNGLDLICHPRSLSEALFTAILDVGIGVGLGLAGLGTVPVSRAWNHE